MSDTSDIEPTQFSEVTVEGVTKDFVWYHAELLSRQANDLQRDIKRLTQVMQNRHQEHLKMLDELLKERTALKEKNAALLAAGGAKHE